VICTWVGTYLKIARACIALNTGTAIDGLAASNRSRLLSAAAEELLILTARPP